MPLLGLRHLRHPIYGISEMDYRKIPTQRPPPSKRPPPFSAPKVLQRGHISSCNRPERLFLGTCRLTLYEKCSVMVTFLFHQLSCQMSSRAIAHPLVSGALNAKRPWAIGRDFTVLDRCPDAITPGWTLFLPLIVV